MLGYRLAPELARRQLGGHGQRHDPRASQCLDEATGRLLNVSGAPRNLTLVRVMVLLDTRLISTQEALNSKSR
jgi:hypothetical protein